MVGGIARMLDDGARAFRRYGTDGGRHLVDELRTNRHVLGFVASQLHHPVRVHAATGAYVDALRRQGALFASQRVDDVTDAMRHAGASALVVDRLVQRRTSPGVAAEFMRRLGQAHERDSQLTGAHRAASELMDLHNNELGISTALQHAAAGLSGRAGEQALEGAVLQAISRGRGLVLDSPKSTPRPATTADLRAVLRDPWRIPA